MNKSQSSAITKPTYQSDLNEDSGSHQNSQEEDEPAISNKAMKDMISKHSDIQDGYLQLNNKLMDKICELQEELDAKSNTELQSSFHQDYSLMNADFNEIEEHIKQYKISLTAYQEQRHVETQAKNQLIQKLSEQIISLNSKLDEKAQIIEELQQKYAILEETNRSLQLQLQEMDIQFRRSQLSASKVSKVSKRHSTVYDDYSYDSNDFNDNVQAELQKLINKLMKELQYEQNNKKKLTAQIKRLQLDIIDLEKEIVQKNNKIYSLELKVIKSQRSNLNTTLTNVNSIRASQKLPPQLHNFSFDQSLQNIDTEKTKRREIKQANSYTLQELFNDHYCLDFREKIYLCIRLIETFCEKIRKNDLSLESQSTIAIQNFSLKQPHLYSLRLIKKGFQSHEQEDQTENIQSIMSNLLDLLEQILRNAKFNKKSSASDVREKGVALLLSNAKRNKNLKLQDLLILRQTLEELIQDLNDHQL